MKEKEPLLRTNYIISIINFILFLILLCFAFEATRIILKELKLNEDFKLWVLFLGGAFPLLFYTFVGDLNGIYEKMQHFFFRQSPFSFLMPSILILLCLGYFVVPKLFDISFNKDIFVFLGGCGLMVHLIFLVHQTRSYSFVGFVNYLFVFTALYLLLLGVMMVYLKLGFDLPLGKIIIDSMKDGFALVKSIFVQLSPQ